MSEIPPGLNPYAERGMIRDPQRFFGRKRELDEIFSRLATIQSVSVVGERRIGKSSLLYYITQTGQGRSGPDYMYRYLDLQRVLSTEEFYTRVCKLLGENGNTHDDFEQAIQGKKVVLCLDEFEQATDNPAFDEEFFNVLRSLAQTGELALVVATQHTLSDLYRAEAIPTSPFYNIFSVLRLGLLTDTEARELVTRPAEIAGYPFNEGEIDFLLELGQKHPCWLNVACALLYDAKRREPVNFDEVRSQFEEEVRNLRPAPAVQSMEDQQGSGEGHDKQPEHTVQPVQPVGESVVVIRVAALLAAVGTAIGWLSTQAANLVGVFLAGGILLVAFGLLLNDWLQGRRRRPEA